MEERAALSRLLEECVHVTATLDPDEVIHRTLYALKELFPEADAVAVLDERRAMLGARPQLGSMSLDDLPCYLEAPMLVRGTRLGWLYLGANTTDVFQEVQQAHLMAFAAVIAAAWNNALVVERARAAGARRVEIDAQRALFTWLASVELLEPLARLEEAKERLREVAADPVSVAADLVTNAQTAVDVIEEVLFMSTGTGFLEPRAAPVDVVATLAEISRGSPGSPVIALTDEARFKQVMAYLIAPGARVDVRPIGGNVVIDAGAIQGTPAAAGPLMQAIGGRAGEGTQLILPAAG